MTSVMEFFRRHLRITFGTGALIIYIIYLIFAYHFNWFGIQQSVDLPTHKIAIIKPSAQIKQLSVSDIDTSELLSEINSYRQQNNESPLIPDPRLNQSALNKCNDMVAQNYWSHVSPSGEQPWQFMTDQGITYNKAGENLGEGYDGAEAIFNAWIYSPEHRDNILNSSFDYEGLAVCKSDNYAGNDNKPTLIIVQHFIEP